MHPQLSTEHDANLQNIVVLVSHLLKQALAFSQVLTQVLTKYSKSLLNNPAINIRMFSIDAVSFLLEKICLISVFGQGNYIIFEEFDPWGDHIRTFYEFITLVT